MNNHWHNWSRLGKPAGWSHLHHIAVGQNLDGRLDVLAVSSDGSLWQIWQATANNGWSHWESRGNPAVEGIELTSPAVGQPLAVGWVWEELGEEENASFNRRAMSTLQVAIAPTI